MRNRNINFIVVIALFVVFMSTSLAVLDPVSTDATPMEATYSTVIEHPGLICLVWDLSPPATDIVLFSAPVGRIAYYESFNQYKDTNKFENSVEQLISYDFTTSQYWDECNHNTLNYAIRGQTPTILKEKFTNSIGRAPADILLCYGKALIKPNSYQFG